MTTDAYLGRITPTPNDFGEHYHLLSIEKIRVISVWKKMKQYSQLDMSEEAILTDKIKLCTPSILMQ